MTEGKTLDELDVNPGDVVGFIGAVSEWTMTDEGHLSSRNGDLSRAYFAGGSHAADTGFTIVSRANEPDKPKTWGEMTDAEKGALLLGHHEGEIIQHKLFPTDGDDYDWQDNSEPMFNDIHAYRVRKEPIRETVTLRGGKRMRHGGWRLDETGCDDLDANIITFPTLDGELIHGTYANEAGDVIVMEAIGDE